jgi:hypothetical protein
MRRTFLSGLVMISLAVGGGCTKKEKPVVARVRPPAVRAHVTAPKKATTSRRKPARKARAPVDTATAFNPLLNH